MYDSYILLTLKSCLILAEMNIYIKDKTSCFLFQVDFLMVALSCLLPTNEKQ